MYYGPGYLATSQSYAELHVKAAPVTQTHLVVRKMEAFGDVS
jgi:hypothetical protein